MSWKKFKRLVNGALHVLYHQDRINGLIIRCSYHKRTMHRRSSPTIGNLISFAIERKWGEISTYNDIYQYKFPFISLSDTPGAFQYLQSLRFRYVDIEDNVLHYFFESCPHLEDLCIKSSRVTKKVEFGDPLPNIKTLEITCCGNVFSLDLCAPNLVSFSNDKPDDFALD